MKPAMKMDELTGSMKAFAIVIYILMICAGMFLLFIPRSVVLLFPISVVVYGIFLIYRYISMKDKRIGWDIVTGVVSILFGAVLLFSGVGAMLMGMVMLEIFVAVWALFTGFSNLFGSLNQKKLGDKNWGWSLAGGILTIICGILLLIWPYMGTFVLAFTFSIFAGIAFIFTGFAGLAAALSGKNADLDSAPNAGLQDAEPENKPVEKKPEEDKPEEDKPGEDKPEEDKPEEDKPAEDKSEENKP